MRPGMKMLLISGRDDQRNDRDMRNENDMDSRYRDSRGREHRENGEYAVRNYGGMNNREMDMESGGYGGMEMGMDNMESRRRRDSRGRFRSEMGDMNGGYSNQGGDARMGGYPNRPFPVYERGGQMNQIGFYAGDEVQTNYRMNATHQTGDEMEHRSSPKMGGGYSSDMSMPMTREIAEEWTKGMKNEDGTKGPHWKMEQVKQLMAQKGIQCDPWEFFVILNAMYSDYCAVLKKHGVNTIDLYVDLACAWLNDSDAMPDKASRYYEYVVKK